MTSKEMKQLRLDIKKSNQRLRELEKRGLAKSSQAYKVREAQAFGNNKFTKTHYAKTQKGQFKFRTALTGMGEKELKKHKEIIDKFLTSKTSTVTGTKSALKKGYTKYTKAGGKMNISDFGEFWKNASDKGLKDMYASSELENIRSLYEKTDLDIDELNKILSEMINGKGYNIAEENFEKINDLKSEIFSDIGINISDSDALKNLADNNWNYELTIEKMIDYLNDDDLE